MGDDRAGGDFGVGDDFDLLFRQGMETLAGVEPRLISARGTLPPEDVAELARLAMDATSALLLLRALREGDMGRARFRREAGRLKLEVAALTLARLPQPVRLGALDVHGLARRLAARIGRSLDAPVPVVGMPQSKKPRRQQGHPRLQLVTDPV